MTRWLHVCLLVAACAVAASAASELGERPITDADEVLAIYTNDLGRGGGRDEPNVILAAWPDGRVVWSADRLEGGPPYREGKIEPEKIADLFKQFDADGLFSDESLNQPNFGPDSSYTSLLVKFGKKQVEMQSWHELYEALGKAVAKRSGLVGLEGRRRLDVLRHEPAEYVGYRFVWSETRGRMMDLIPDESQPSRGQPVMEGGKISWQSRSKPGSND